MGNVVVLNSRLTLGLLNLALIIVSAKCRACSAICKPLLLGELIRVDIGSCTGHDIDKTSVLFLRLVSFPAKLFVTGAAGLRPATLLDVAHGSLLFTKSILHEFLLVHPVLSFAVTDAKERIFMW